MKRANFISKRGVTLIEAVIATVIFSIIAATLIKLLFALVRINFRSGSTTVTQQMVFNMGDTILSDLRWGSRTALGSVALNGGFEQTNGSVPKYWAPATTGAGGSLSYLQGASNSHSGLRAVQLNSTVGLVTYDCANLLPVTPGQAYMLTGYLNTSGAGVTAKISVLNQAGVEIAATSSITSNSWKMVTVRFPNVPSPGLYTDQAATGNLVRLRLSVSSNGQASFDDVSLSALNSILIIDPPASSNVNGTVLNAADPADPAGFKFITTYHGAPALFRYRITGSGSNSVFYREVFDQTWTTLQHTSISKLRQMSISYDDNYNVPNNGKESVVKFSMGFDDSSGNLAIQQSTIRPTLD